MTLKGKKILLGITGSIAAYKSVFLVRLLVKEGAEVKVIMTSAARDFITPLTLSTLSKNPVLSELFDEGSWSNHVMLGRWADMMVIAPLSVNTLAKMANGQCDNLLLATWLSATCPVLLAPAMDEDMWQHPATKINLDKLTSFGNRLMPVGRGELASGLFGDGRMAEPEAIVEYLREALAAGPLSGKKALVTAGPTYEAIDPVRFIGNHSSGKMGIAIAGELARRGAEVTLVLGPTAIAVDLPSVTVKKVVSAAEMFEACDGLFDRVDLAVMSAAVADYRPVSRADQKIKKTGETLDIGLTRTTDILHTLGQRKKEGQVLVGFALETINEQQSAMEKLEKKNADMIVLNSLNDEGAGFGHDTNKVTVFRRDAPPLEWPVQSKQDVAAGLVDLIIKTYYA
ncbi:MAG: bifunctional phosphopantothenoylcysteine decarboxylase/phosphopantothenate--cysteine ligase CoaBC [Chitinophagaceae bacterium]|nr:MAG: bifunctional phosphopantothenoylcysteine decarboxylase/phosphopantothenate--cysteine ligase CoaBC [Chitinophagaceae bacterium]